MKKILFNLLLIFTVSLCVNISDVYAVSCSDKKQNCAGFDDNKHYCVSHGAQGGCVEAQCGEIPYPNCAGAIDIDGEKCVQYDYRCLKESTATAYKEKKEIIPSNNNSDGYDNYESNGDVTCGDDWTFNKSIANITYYMVLIFQIIAPIALIILGMIDLFKGITSGKEDEMKKGQATFIKRLVVAFLLFSVITIVRMVLNILSTDTIIDCFDCFVNGAKSCDKSL